MVLHALRRRGAEGVPVELLHVEQHQTKLVARKNLEIASLRQETIGELTGLAEEYYKGRNIIKAYNREEDSAAAMEDAAERTRKAAQLADFITISVNPLIRMIARFSQMAVMLLEFP